MALGYTVNWIEQTRTPLSVNEVVPHEIFQTEYRYVLWMRRFYRQSRTRTGTRTSTTVKTLCRVTYKAETVTSGGATTQITEQQAKDIQRDAYANGCIECSTSREQGPNFSATKIVEEASPLISETSSTDEWEEWGDWTPPMPSSQGDQS